MRRLLISTLDFPPTRGGIQTMASEIGKRIRDFDVRVVAPAHPAAAEFDARLSVPVRRAPAVPGGRWATYASVNATTAREARAWKPDVALAMHVLAAPASLASGIPTVVTTYAVELLSPRIRPIARRVLPRAQHVVAISSFTADHAASLGAPRTRTSVVPVGAPEARPIDKDAVRAFRARHGLGGDPVILTVARLVPHKGVDVAIRALRGLGESVRYLVVGDGPQRAELETLARSLGVDGRVRFAGWLDDQDLATAYASADAFALFSRDAGRSGVEGGGIVLLEASAYGLPVVATRTGGITDVVEHDHTGLLVEQGSVDEAIRGLSSVLGDPELAERLGNAAKLRATTERSWQAVVETFEGILSNIAGEAAR